MCLSDHVVSITYDGYYIPIEVDTYIHAYTPWAVMKYLNTAYLDKDYTPQNYWTGTGASTILKRLFAKERCINSAWIKTL